MGKTARSNPLKKFKLRLLLAGISFLLNGQPVSAGETLLHFTFDSIGPNGQLEDACPLPNNGRIIGGAYSPVDGIKGKALLMDGTKNLVLIPASHQLDIDFKDGFTIQFWFKPGVSGATGERKVLLSRKYDSGTSGYRLEYVPAARMFVFSFASGARTVNINSCRLPVPINENTWYHLAVVGRNRELSYYLNGVRISTGKIEGDISPGDEPLRIGGYASVPGKVGPFVGAIDDLWIKTGADEDFSEAQSLAPVKLPVSWQTLFRLPIPEELPGHPRVFVTARELERIKTDLAGGDEYTRTTVDHIRKSAEPYLAQKIDFGAGKAGGLGKNLEPIAALAQVYAITGEEPYGRRARELLVDFAVFYQTLQTTPVHGRYAGNTLHEMETAVTCAMAYDLIANAPFVTPDDHQKIKEMFRTMAWECGHKCHHTDSSNWRTRANAILASCGFAIGDRQLIDEAINGAYDEERGAYLYGIVQQLTHSTFSDGIHWERALGYTVGITVDAMMYVIVPADNSGIDIWHAKLPGIPGPFQGCASHDQYGPGDRSLKALLDAQFYYSFHNFPNNGKLGRCEAYADSCNPDIIYHDIYKLAYQKYQDPKYAWLISSRGRPADFWNLVHGPKSAPAGYFNLTDDARIGLTGRHENGCTLFPAGGFAVLRSNPTNLASASCLLTFGPLSAGHCHPDMLHFSLYGQGEIVCPDSGLHPYPDPLHGGWDQQTISHNTMVVDEVKHNHANQKINEVWKFFEPFGVARLFYPGKRVKVIRATCSNAYEGVMMDRTLALVGSYVLDMFRVKSDKEHTYDLALHGRGEVKTTAELPLLDKNPFTAAGYMQLAQVRRGTPPPGVFRADFVEGNRSVLVLRPHPPGSEVIIGKDPGGAYYRGKTEVSSLISRQRGKKAVFITLMEPHAGAPTVQSLSVKNKKNGTLEAIIKHKDGLDSFVLPKDPAGAMVVKRRDADGNLVFEELSSAPTPRGFSLYRLMMKIRERWKW